jgi:hypothetical protein
MTRIVSINDLLKERRERGDEIEVAELQRPIGEMITTSGRPDGSGPEGSCRCRVRSGGSADAVRADLPARQRPVPWKSVDIGENTLQANVVFFEKLEGGEVQFGTLQKGAPASARSAHGPLVSSGRRTWRNGTTWQFELVNQAFGRAYNQFLNHAHLSPIFTTRTRPKQHGGSHHGWCIDG